MEMDPEVERKLGPKKSTKNRISTNQELPAHERTLEGSPVLCHSPSRLCTDKTREGLSVAAEDYCFKYSMDQMSIGWSGSIVWANLE